MRAHRQWSTAWWLQWLLRILAVGASLRLTLLLPPRSWLERLIPFFGLGPYPGGPAMDYLLRTTSAIYFLGGWFCWSVSGDLLRNKPGVRFLGWATALYGVMVAGADGVFGGAAGWQIGTGLGTVVLGIVMLRLGMTIRPQSLPGDAPEGGTPAPGGLENVPGLSGPERTLRSGLRCVGSAVATGIVGVIVPQSVLRRALTVLDPELLPETPMVPIMVFLMRSLFGACFLGGVFFWMVSMDVCRHAAVARFLGWASVLFGAIIALTDLGSRLPWWLRLVAPLACAVGVAIICLSRASTRGLAPSSPGPKPLQRGWKV